MHTQASPLYARFALLHAVKLDGAVWHLCQAVVNARMWFTLGMAVNELLRRSRVTDVAA